MAARYLLGDWGTTNLRLYLMEHDQVVEVREGPGIGGLREPPARVLAAMVQQWFDAAAPIDITLCGMASSRSGLRELPYVKAPATVMAWAQGAQNFATPPFEVWLATGMQCGSDAAGFDVMRGEETQIFGALQLEPQLQRGSQCFVLPGTHSKWVQVEGGVVTRFSTAITGELYAVLSRHSTLLAADTVIDEPEFDAGFNVGAEWNQHSNESLLTAVFKTRTAQLLQGRSPAWASGFLSGVLIAYELASMRETFSQPAVITLVGQRRLVALYERIGAMRGISLLRLDGAECVLAGLRQLRALRTNH